MRIWIDIGIVVPALIAGAALGLAAHLLGVV